MADLTYTEQETIENFLRMENGYVMDFSNRTFQEFIIKSVGRNIYDEKYNYDSNSKANRLRRFIEVESNYTVGTLLSAFCEYWRLKVNTIEIDQKNDENLYNECLKIAERLKKENIVEDIDANILNVDDKNIELLAKIIRDSIDKNEPGAALDRLHTLIFGYLRNLCDIHKISYEKSDSLNAVYGKYIKFLIDNKHIESDMAEKILKYSINVIEAFNDIRNNRSLSHYNKLLNYQESILIYNYISITINFIISIEEQIKNKKEPEQADWNDLPF
jgi:hypothetical protein